MGRPEALLKILNNNEEPPKKRLRIADNAFSASEFQMHRKEAFLLKWILNSTTQFSKQEVWSVVIRWLSSNDFKNLAQNDIINDDISSIVKLFQGKLVKKNVPIIEQQQIVESVVLLCDNKVFQQYFRYNIELYCRLISFSLEIIDCPLNFVQFITKPFLFPKSVLVQEDFVKHFLDLLYPLFVKKALKFAENKHVFDEIVGVIQKCLLQENIQQFQRFVELLFEPQNDTKETQIIPKTVFKYLILTLEEDDSTTFFKLFFSAFLNIFNDSHWSFKCLIYAMELLQFDISKDIQINLPFQQKINTNLTKSLKVLLIILEEVSTKSFTDCSLSGISFSEFLRNILRSVIALNILNSTVFEIIDTCILIYPLVIEPLVSDLIPFIMNGNHDEMNDSYEKTVKAIFEVFGKLHRVENLIAKIIPALKSSLALKNQLDTNENMKYRFKGITDIEIRAKEKVSANDIFTKNILECFTTCLIGLASWQVFNVFKTMLYHLTNAVQEYANKNSSNDSNEFTFLEILGTLTTCLLQSVKIADHTTPQNVVVKFGKGLEELKALLKEFGPAILKRQHSHVTMRTFLNLAYIWAEIYVTLTYYSVDNEVQATTVIDNTYSAANLKYLHSYMDIKQWQLIAERITNFGGYPCKKLLQKLYIQKLRAMLLFEKNLTEDITTNIVKTLQSHMEDTWQDLLSDKFSVNFVLPKMDRHSLIYLAEHLIESDHLLGKDHIMDSITLINATLYVVMSKINKLFKLKRKHDGEQNKSFSSKVFFRCPEGIFFSNKDHDITEAIEHIMNLEENWEDHSSTGIGSKEVKLRSYLNVLKKMPFVYSSVNIQKIVLLYLLSLNKDILACSEEVKRELENLIIGTLEACKFPLTDIFKMEILGAQVLTNNLRHEVLFSLFVDNVFKHEKSVLNVEPLVLYLIHNLEESRHLNSSILVLHAVNKVKKSKMSTSIKEKANQYREKIFAKLSKLVCQSDNLIEAYATCLKYYLSIEKDSETLKTLLDKLGSYLKYSLENISNENKKGCAILFTAVLQNKSRIQDIESDIVLNIWNAFKRINIGDEYSHLVKLIVTLIPNGEFEMLVADLLHLTEEHIKTQSYAQLGRQLKTWECILTCDVNPTKMKIWQAALENLIYELSYILRNGDYDDVLYKSIIHLEQSIIQTPHFILSSPLIDMLIMTVSVLMRHDDQHFAPVFGLSVSILEMFLKYRNAITMDRLPAFLQQYRVLLNSITSKSNSDESGVQSIDVKTASDCVHTLEKLTKNLASCKKDMGRIAVFLVADILETYEQINLYPNVKLHLNNCVYSLMSLCDHHAVSYLMRVLSSASTEMFKIMYEHYKKYYMFTGKV